MNTYEKIKGRKGFLYATVTIFELVGFGFAFYVLFNAETIYQATTWGGIWEKLNITLYITTTLLSAGVILLEIVASSVAMVKRSRMAVIVTQLASFFDLVFILSYEAVLVAPLVSSALGFSSPSEESLLFNMTLVILSGTFRVLRRAFINRWAECFGLFRSKTTTLNIFNEEFGNQSKVTIKEIIALFGWSPLNIRSAERQMETWGWNGHLPGAYDAATQMYYTEKVYTGDFSNKNILVGMIKVQQKIPLDLAAQMVHKSRQELEGLIYELAAENKVEGHFDGTNFIITSDLDTYITALKLSFDEWEKRSI